MQRLGLNAIIRAIIFQTQIHLQMKRRLQNNRGFLKSFKGVTYRIIYGFIIVCMINNGSVEYYQSINNWQPKYNLCVLSYTLIG